MKIQGAVKGIIRSVETGEITQEFGWESNHIQDWYLSYISNIAALGNSNQMGVGLWISEANPGVQKRDWPSIQQGCYKGANIAGISSPELFLDDAPGVHVGQWLQRFPAPPADITVNLAGICSYVEVETIPDRAIDASTAVWLSSPCVLTTLETLDLYYRVQFMFDADWKNATVNSLGMTRYEAEILAMYLTNISNTYLLVDNNLTHRTTSLSRFNPRKLDISHSGETDTVVTASASSDTLDGDNFKKTHTAIFGVQDEVGRLLGTIHANATAVGYKVNPVGATPIQSVFGHRSTSVTPFYSPATSQIGLGQLQVNGDAWLDSDFPLHITLDVTADGLTGVSTYQFKTRKHFGYIDNTYLPVLTPLYYSGYANGHYAGNFPLCRDGMETFATLQDSTAAAVPKQYYGVQTFFMWKDAFCITDIMSGDGVTFDNTTLVGVDLIPYFQATNIVQFAVEANNDFFVACKNTGLYHFNAALDTLTVINNTFPGLANTGACHGVCVGNAGRVWAYFDHTTAPSIYYSDDSGANWVATGFSDVYLDANPGAVYGLQADINNATGQLAVIYTDDVNNVTELETFCMWWDQFTTTASQGPQISSKQKGAMRDEPHSLLDMTHSYYYQDLLLCSPNNSFWAATGVKAAFGSAMQPAFFTFGSATYFSQPVLDALDLAPGSHVTVFVKDAAGNDAILYNTRSGDTGVGGPPGVMTMLVSRDGTYESKTLTTSSTQFSGSENCLYYGEGVWLVYDGYSDLTKTFISNTNLYYLCSAIPPDPDFSLEPGLKAEFWPTYGWNGSSWEKGHAGSKATHAAAQALYDGVTVAWDDVAGTAQFLSSDHYTFGVFDGVWLDGSTTFDFDFQLFAKPTTSGTAVEAGTLPATPKVANMISYQPAAIGEYQDDISTVVATAGDLKANGTATVGVYNAGARSTLPAIFGDVIASLPNHSFLPDSDVNNVQGWLEFTTYIDVSYELEYYVGVSPVAVLATALNSATIGYGIHLDSLTPANGPGTCDIRVVESSFEKAIVSGIPYGTTTGITCRICLLTNGAMLYQYKPAGLAWFTLYQSAPGLVTIDHNLHMDVQNRPQNSYGLIDVTWNYLDTANPDYYMYLGNGVDSGLFATDFFAIDAESIVVTINGVQAVHVGINDSVTVLPANSYSLFPSFGVIRYSASDVGKTVTASYITITQS